MSSNKSAARLAGFFYVLLIITGMFSLVYVPSQLMIKGNAIETISNIRTSEFLFRLGIVSGLLCQILYIFLPLSLYKLLQPVNKTHASLMVILALVSVPISLVAISNKFDVLTLLSNAEYLKSFDVSQLNAQIMLALSTYSNTIFVASIFWGLWLFPFGYLVFKSGFLPKFFGLFLMAGCFGYLIDIIGTTLFASSYAASGIQIFISLPSAIGEIGIGFWLLIMGAKEAPRNALTNDQ